MEILWIVFWCLLGLLLAGTYHLCQTNHVFNYYAKNTYFYVTVVSIATLSCVYGWIRPRHPYNILPICSVVCTTRWLLGLKVETRNQERLVSNTPYILVANHQSGLDMLCMSWIIPDRCVAIIKKELIYTAQFGLSAWLCGSIFIDRVNPEQARKTMDGTVARIKNNNLKVWVFPEGTRGREDVMLPFKKGGFHLAVGAQIPIVPVVVSSCRPFYRKKQKIFNSGKIIISVLPSVSTVGLTTADVTKLSVDMRSTMMEEYNKTKLEIADYCAGLPNNTPLPNDEKKTS